MFGFDPSSGAGLWTLPKKESPVDPQAVDPAAGTGGTLVYPEGNEDGGAAVVAVDLSNRHQLWRHELKEPARGAPTIVDGKVYFGARDDVVYCLDLASGSVDWSQRLAGRVDAAPAVADGRVFVTAENTQTGTAQVYALATDPGAKRVVWTHQLGFGLHASSASIAGEVVVLGFGDGSVRAFDAEAGDQRWSESVRGSFSPLTTPAVDGDAVYVADRTGGVYRFDLSSGRKVWDYQFAQAIVRASPLVDGAHLLVGLNDGTLAALDTALGHLRWQTTLNAGPMGSPVPAGELLVVPSLGRHGGIVAFRHDPAGTLIDQTSPTVLNLPVALANFAGAFLALFVFTLLGFRLLSRRVTAPFPPSGDPKRNQPQDHGFDEDGP